MSKKNGGIRPDLTEEERIAYFWGIVRNMNRMERRQNANAKKHTAPTGIWFDGYKAPLASAEDVENQIAHKTAEDWLCFINNKRLHAALSSLKQSDLEFIFLFYSNGFTERQVADFLGVHQNAVHKRKKRILKRIKTFF